MPAALLLVVLSLLLGAGQLGAAEAAAADPQGGSLTAGEINQLAALLLPAAQNSLELKTGLGFDSNVLLASTAREQSGFARADLEAFLWHQPQGARSVEFTGFLNASHREFFSSPESPSSSEAFAQAEARWRPVPALRLTLRAQGYYLDSVVDLSTESDRLATRLQMMGTVGGGVVRWDLGQGFWTEATGTVNRSSFHNVPEDYSETRAILRAGWQSANGLVEIGGSLSSRWRHYEERNQTTAAGRARSGTELRYRLPQGELTAVLRKAWHGDWRLNTALNTSRNQDNGGGYFDYWQHGVRLELEWTDGPWEAGINLAASRYRWEVQTVGIGLDPPLRSRTDRSSSARLERRFGTHWLAFAEAEREWVDANDDASRYTATRISAGAGWKY